MKILILANHQLGLHKFRAELIEALVEKKHSVYISVPPAENKPEAMSAMAINKPGAMSAMAINKPGAMSAMAINKLEAMSAMAINKPGAMPEMAVETGLETCWKAGAQMNQDWNRRGVRTVYNRYLDRRGTNPAHELRLLFYYKWLLEKIKPDVVLTYTIKPNVYGGFLCGRMGVPYIANVTGLGTAVHGTGGLQAVALGLYKAGLKRAQKVFLQNMQDCRFLLEKHVLCTAYDVLPGSGVNLVKNSCQDYPDDACVHFLFVARIMKEKGIEEYLRAAGVVRGRHPQARFHVCGCCERGYEKMIKEAEGRGDIVYHGLVADMSGMYRIASCIVHPTYYPEGMSNVLLESCANGRPIITTDRPGCREVVEDGVNGFVVREKDSRDLVKQIEKFLSLPAAQRKQMGINGRKKVEREFDRTIVVRKYMDEIERAATKNQLY